MKVLITGAQGQLGSELVRQLAEQHVDALGCDREQFDLTDAQAVRAAVEAYMPNVIIHCAAYTAVDKAESEPTTCFQINSIGTLNIVNAALAVGATLVYISTDYVFHGDGEAPFEVKDTKGPLNIYGLSKLQGEEAIRSMMSRYFIIRTSWVFGEGHNFVRTMRHLGRSQQQVRVVSDQIGSPTYAHDLAQIICAMIRTTRYGIYHATNEGLCSWAEFAEAIMRHSHLSCRVIPVTTAEYGQSAAKRPLNSRLSKASLDRAGFERLPHWEDALVRYLATLPEGE